MPVYLAELYCNEGFRRGCELISRALASGFPPGVTLKARHLLRPARRQKAGGDGHRDAAHQ
jgi:hypothetical protein